MLARKYRIPRREMFGLSRGKYFPLGIIEYRYISRSSGPARIACVIPKSVLKHSIDRHRFKRIVYATFLNYKDEISPVDVVIRPKHGWDDKTPWKKSLQQSVKEVLFRV